MGRTFWHSFLTIWLTMAGAIAIIAAANAYLQVLPPKDSFIDSREFYTMEALNAFLRRDQIDARVTPLAGQFNMSNGGAASAHLGWGSAPPSNSKERSRSITCSTRSASPISPMKSAWEKLTWRSGRWRSSGISSRTSVPSSSRRAAISNRSG